MIYYPQYPEGNQIPVNPWELGGPTTPGGMPPQSAPMPPQGVIPDIAPVPAPESPAVSPAAPRFFTQNNGGTPVPQSAPSFYANMSAPDPEIQVARNATERANRAAIGASIANFLATLGGGLAGGTGINNPNAGTNAYDQVMKNYQVGQKAAERVAEARQLKKKDALTQFAEQRAASKAQREETDWRRQQTARDPNSVENKAWRERFAVAYPDVVKRLPEGVYASLTAEQAAKDPMLVRMVDDDRRNREMQAASDIRKGEYDYKKEEERTKAAITGRGYWEAERASGKEAVARGGLEDPAEAIRIGLKRKLNDIDPNYLKDRPDVSQLIETIRGKDYGRGTSYKQILGIIDDLGVRNEKEKLLAVPGWTRADTAGDLQPAEGAQSRAAQGAFQSIRASVNRIKQLRDQMSASVANSIESGISIASAGTYLSEEMAEANQEYENIMSNIRVLNNYGAPQEFEMIRLEQFMPRFNSVTGFINGKLRYEALVKAAERRFSTGMEAKGYIRATNTLGGRNTP